MDRNRPPTIRDESGNLLNVATLPRRDGNEVPRRGASPEPNIAAELEDHWCEKSNAYRLVLSVGRRGEKKFKGQFWVFLDFLLFLLPHSPPPSFRRPICI